VLWQRKEALRKNVIQVDDFPQDFGRAAIVERLPKIFVRQRNVRKNPFM